MPNAADDGEQPGFVLRHHETGHGEALQRRADQERRQAADAVGDRAPDLPAEHAEAEQQRQHRGAALRRIAEVGAERDQVVLRHRHGHAAQERGDDQQREHHVRRPAEDAAAFHRVHRPCRWRPASPAAFFRKMSASGTINGGHEQAIDQHGGLPAEMGDRALEDRRPDRAGEIEPAREQRERRAAAAVEPAADIDIERRVEAGIAEQSDEHAVAEIELPGLRRASRSRARCRPTRRRRSPSCGCRSAPPAAPSSGRRASCRTRRASWRVPAPSGRRRSRRRSPSGRPRRSTARRTTSRASRAKRSRRPRRIASRCLELTMSGPGSDRREKSRQDGFTGRTEGKSIATRTREQCTSMIPKSGNRFSEKIMLQCKSAGVSGSGRPRAWHRADCRARTRSRGR